MTALIPANTTIPTRKSETFSTASDNQPSVEIHVLQGDRSMAVDNRTIGRFHLDGIPPAPRGLPQVEVTFDIDADGILSVSAKDKATGKEQSIRIEASSGLSDAEIEAMRRAARENANDDQKRKESIDKLNQADSLIFSTEKNMADYGDKIPAEKKAAIEAGLERLREVHKGQDLEQLDSALEQLNTAWSAAAEDLYRAQQAEAEEGGADATAAAQAAAEDAGPVSEDADFEVVDEGEAKA